MEGSSELDEAMTWSPHDDSGHETARCSSLPREDTARRWRSVTEKASPTAPQPRQDTGLGFPASGTVRSRSRSFLSHPLSGLPLEQPEQTKTRTRLKYRFSNSPN